MLPKIEIVAIQVAMEHPIILIIIYVPPNSSHQYYLGLFSYLNETSTKGKVIMIGNFNFPDINWATLTVCPCIPYVLRYSISGYN